MATPPLRRRPRHVLRIVLLSLVGLVVLGIAGIGIFVASFNPNSYKPQIIAAVQSATGRQLTLNGRIGLSLSLQPTLQVSDVAFANPPGFSRPQMATLQRLELQLALVPLLSKHVQIEKLVLVRPDILLETNAQGHSNWEMTPASAAPPPAAQAAPSSTGTESGTTRPSIALSRVQIEDGTLAMRNAAGKTTTLDLTKLDATSASPGAPLHVTVAATYNGTPLSVTADTGPLRQMLAPGTTAPWPVKLAIAAAGAKIGVDGTIAQPQQGRGMALNLTADVPDLAALGTFAGFALPPLKTVTAQFRLADGTDGKSFTVSDLKLAMPQLDMAGTASFTPGAHPVVQADLTSNHIDLDALDAALSGGAPARAGKAAPGAATSGHVIPDTKLPIDTLRALDADSTVAVADLKSGGADYKALKLHAVLRGGQLSVDPFDVDAPGGRIDAKLTANANASPPTVALTLQAPILALQPLLKALGKPGYASGNLEIQADLKGAGDSPHAIAATLDGAIGVAMVGGEIDSQVMGGMLAGLVQQTQFAGLANQAGMSAVKCFALRLDARNGVGTLRALQLDSSSLNLEGSGGMNFGSETLDMRLKLSVGIAGTSIAAPVIVGGSFAHPSVRPDEAGLVAANVGTAAKLALGASTGGIGLIIGSALEKTESSGSCAGPLALARFSQPPAGAPQESGKAPQAAPPAAPPKQNLGGAIGALKKLFP